MNGKPRRYWFLPKRYGWGWTPTTWQGWLVVILWIAVFTPIFTWLLLYRLVVPLLLFTVVMAAIITAICYVKGPSPRWQPVPRHILLQLLVLIIVGFIGLGIAIYLARQ